LEENDEDSAFSNWTFENYFLGLADVCDDVLNIIGSDLNQASNVIAGFGDKLSFGKSKEIRDEYGLKESVNYDSKEYSSGKVIGAVHRYVLEVATVKKVTPVSTQTLALTNTIAAAFGLGTWGTDDNVNSFEETMEGMERATILSGVGSKVTDWLAKSQQSYGLTTDNFGHYFEPVEFTGPTLSNKVMGGLAVGTMESSINVWNKINQNKKAAPVDILPLALGPATPVVGGALGSTDEGASVAAQFLENIVREVSQKPKTKEKDAKEKE